MTYARNLALGLSAAVVFGAGALSPSALASPAGIAFGACDGAPAGDSVRCGHIDVPVDWPRPDDGTTTTIQVAKLPAADPAHRIGTLFFNPGGPGEGEVGYLVSAAARNQVFPAELRTHFDIVAVEPRGTGTNAPLNCAPPIDTTVTGFPATARQAADLARSNERLGTACAQAAGPIFGHLDTGSVARDMDAVRTALGQQRISFLGLSYGTMLAQQYAELFPQHVRTMVLDGVVDRSLSWRTLAERDAVAVQDGVRRFADWSGTHPDSALHGTDVPAFLTALQERADQGKITDGQRQVRAEEIAQAVNNGLQSPQIYPQLATALHDADQRSSLTPLTGFTNAGNGEYAMYRAIICQDVPVPPGSETRFPAEVRRLHTLAPTLRGYSEFWNIASGCAGWPAVSHWTPHTWRVPAGFPPVLLLSGTHDVATPAPFAAHVRATLPNSGLLTWTGDGHTAWDNSPSTVATAADFLVNMTMPPGAR